MTDSDSTLSLKTLAKHYKVASPQELLETALDMDDLIDGLQEPAGAATALAATEGATTLFI